MRSPSCWSASRSAWPTRETGCSRRPIAVGLTGLIEILQFWAPGRHARLEDFLVDALAACVGLAAAAAFDWIIKRTQRSSAGAS